MKYAGIPLRDPALAQLFGVRETTSGVYVDEHSANSMAAYFSGVNLIANSMAMLPFNVQTKKLGSKGYAINYDHIGTHLLNIRPNVYDTPVLFRSQMQTYAVTWGNAYAYIERDNTNKIINLWPLDPQNVTPKMDNKNIKIYECKEGKEKRTYSHFDILHIPGMAYDGLRGYSAISAGANETIALALASEKYGASYFGNNAIPGGILTHPGSLDETGKQNLQTEFEDKVKGPYKSRRVVVLDEGLKYTQIGIPPEDSQFLQTRVFQIKEIARWLRIPPHLLYEMENQVGINNLESLGIDFLTYSLGPWVDRWVQEIQYKLLYTAEYENRESIVVADPSKFLRMDSAALYAKHTGYRNMGVLTLNDILQDLGMATIDNELGEMRITPSTMKPLGDDPTTPIEPQRITDIIALFTSLSGMVKESEATTLINSIIPYANDKVTKALIETLKRRKLINETP